VAARFPRRRGIVAAQRQLEVNAELSALPYYLGFGQLDEWRMDADARALHAGLRREVGHSLERGDVFGTAVGITRVIQDIHAKENILGAKDLGPGEREREKDRVAGWDVGDWDLGVRSPVFRDRNVGGEGGAAEGAEIDFEDSVLDDADRIRHPSRRVELDAMPLPVTERKRVTGEALGLGDRERRGGVDASREEHNSRFWHGVES